MSKRLLMGALVVSLSVVAAAQRLQTRIVAASSSPRKLIPAPTRWVPFSADLMRIEGPKHVKLTGRFYRAADGSTRADINMPDNTGRTLTTIHSVAEHRTYVGSGAHWRAFPMAANPSHQTPPQILASNPGYVKYQWRLALKQGEDGSLKSNVGFVAYRERDRPGHLLLMVPTLNWFVVASGHPDDFDVVYSNIAIGPQPASLFAPPTGANVIFSSNNPLRRGGGMR